MGFIDWMADKVQSFTGEKERRHLVDEIKNHFEDFKVLVKKLVKKLNSAIKQYNNKLKGLNAIRRGTVKNNIFQLYNFLSIFGHVKDIGSYTRESEKMPESLPNQQFKKVEDYIADVDWSQKDVFKSSFFLTVFGMKFKTKKQNLAMREFLNEFKLSIEQTKRELETKIFSVQREKQICELYIESIKFISEFITDRILPELSLVEAFLQAEQLKNHLIADLKSEVVFNYKVNVLKGTIYKKHYNFVRNAFMFYILSCKIYNTPILTRLLNNNTTAQDVKDLARQKNALFKHGQELLSNVMIKCG